MAKVTPPKDSVAEFVTKARLKMGLTQQELGDLFCKTRATVSHWESQKHEPEYSMLLKLSELSGIPLPGTNGTETSSNVSTVGTVYPAVPLISWVQAGNWAEIVDNYTPGENDLVAAKESKPGKYSFALRVEGDSMISHNHISFPPGTIIIVDPARAAGSGDFVVAKDIATGCATFKRLMQDAGHWFLKPLNPAYPLIPIDDPAIRVIGVVIESQIINKL